MIQTEDRLAKAKKQCKNMGHDKCHSTITLTSMPPQTEWICRRCGERGVDVGHVDHDPFEYDRLIGKEQP